MIQIRGECLVTRHPPGSRSPGEKEFVIKEKRDAVSAKTIQDQCVQALKEGPVILDFYGRRVWHEINSRLTSMPDPQGSSLIHSLATNLAEKILSIVQSAS